MANIGIGIVAVAAILFVLYGIGSLLYRVPKVGSFLYFSDSNGICYFAERILVAFLIIAVVWLVGFAFWLVGAAINTLIK